MNRTPRIAGSLALVLLLSGCALGPNWNGPGTDDQTEAQPLPSQPLSAGPGEPEQILKLTEELPRTWWHLFGSPAIDQAIRRALAGNHDLAAAEASLDQARFLVAGAEGGLYPGLALSVDATRTDTGSGSGLGGTTGASSRSGSGLYNLYSIGPRVSYALDVFGATRRTVEQRQAEAEASAHKARAAYLSLTGNVVSQALTIASLNTQLEAAHDIVGANQRTVDLVGQQLDAGKAALADLLTAKTDLANARTAIPPLSQQLAVARHALAALYGEGPQATATFNLSLRDISLPVEVPLSVSSTLARQRPDVLQAEANLHAASAAIGVATANLYPSFTLSASLSDDALTLSKLFEASNLGWSLGASLSQTIFDGGTLEANRQAAIANWRAALATYRQTLMDAFRQTADALSALSHDAELVAAERLALDTAREAADLKRLSYAEGKVNLVELLIAERSHQQAVEGYARAVGQRHIDTAQLFVALGGGWWDPPPPLSGAAQDALLPK